MKTLYLIRHAKSSWDYISLRDFDRPLDDRGHAEAKIMAKLLAQNYVNFNQIVCSPSQRTLTTAQYFAHFNQFDEDKISKIHDLYQASENEILKVIQNFDDDAKVIGLVGHNLGLTDFMYQYCVASNFHYQEIPTCGVVKIELNAKSWKDFNSNRIKLLDFWTPKSLMVEK